MVVAALEPSAAHAQAAGTLVSNTGQSVVATALPVGIDGGSVWTQSQQFVTGNHADGYVLLSVVLHITNFNAGNPSIRASAQVSIYSNAAGDRPDTSLLVLTNPANIVTSALNTFTAPETAPLLEPNTSYHVVVEASTGGFATQVTRSDAEDAGAASGWSIRDTRWWRNSDGGSGPITVAIADEDNRIEGFDAPQITFPVTLSRASPNAVKVDFTTVEGGTATALDDYWPKQHTIVFVPGWTTVASGVALIPDTVTEGGERVKVMISNARLLTDDGERALAITTAEATGTIDDGSGLRAPPERGGGGAAVVMMGWYRRACGRPGWAIRPGARRWAHGPATGRGRPHGRGASQHRGRTADGAVPGRDEGGRTCGRDPDS